MHKAQNAQHCQPKGEEVSARALAEKETMTLLLAYRKTRRAELKDRIVLRYANLVESVARRYSGTAEPMEDLAQEGYIGLITAVDLYDPSKQVKFSTYATHFIIGQIKHYLRDKGKIIKEPAWLQELNQRVSKAVESLTQQLGRPPSYGEVASVTGMPEENVAELMTTREIFKVGSIHGTTDNDDDSSAVDMERQSKSDVAVSFQLPVEDRIVLDAAMDKLKELEQTVVYAFYFQDKSQTEIARSLDISCNYVSHILRNSTKKLKKILATDEVRDARSKSEQTRAASEQNGQGANSIVDPLTRLYNRCYYESRLAEEIQKASRAESEVSVLFVQLVGWQAFSRANGTLKTDEVITQTAAALRKTLRRVDIVTRYADDSFGLILPFTGEYAGRIAARVENVLANTLRNLGVHWGRTPLNVSCGWAVSPTEHRTSAELTATAQARCQESQEMPLLKAA